MSDDSLLAKDEAQLRLFEEEKTGGGFLAVTSAEGDYTAERLFSQDPNRYRAVLLLLARGCGPREIIRQVKAAFGVGVNARTIAAVMNREHDRIATVKERLGRENLLLASGLQELMAEKIIDGSLIIDDVRGLQSVAVTLGILQQRGAELLDGGQVVRVEHTHRKFGGLDDLMRALPGGGDPNVIDVEQEEITGFGASEAPAKRADRDPATETAPQPAEPDDGSAGPSVPQS